MTLRFDDWDEAKHPRMPPGSATGGEFASAGGSPVPSSHATRALHAKALREGGFTYDVIQHSFPTSGFVVSAHPEAEVAIKGQPKAGALRTYIAAHAEALKQPGAKVGAWHDVEADRWYLDVVEVVLDRARAVALAQEHNQEGIYDLASGTTVYTKVPGARRKDSAHAGSVFVLLDPAELDPDAMARLLVILARAPRRDDWDEAKHPRVPAGSGEGGQFTAGGGGEAASSGGSLTAGQKAFIKKMSNLGKTDEVKAYLVKLAGKQAAVPPVNVSPLAWNAPGASGMAASQLPDLAGLTAGQKAFVAKEYGLGHHAKALAYAKEKLAAVKPAAPKPSAEREPRHPEQDPHPVTKPFVPSGKPEPELPDYPPPPAKSFPGLSQAQMENRQPVAKEPAHWGQEETSVKQPPAEYGSQLATNPETGKPYSDLPKPAAPGYTPEAAAYEKATKTPAVPKPAAPEMPSKPFTMSAGQKAYHKKLVNLGLEEKAAAYKEHLKASFVEAGGLEKQVETTQTPSFKPVVAAPSSWAPAQLQSKIESVHTELGYKKAGEVSLMLADTHDAWRNALPASEHSALSHYKGSGYTSMNSGLRENNVASMGEENRARSLTHALDSAPKLTQDTEVWRGFRFGQLAANPEKYLADKQGILHDNGFLSTSFHSHTSISFGGSNPQKSVLMKIHIPAGTRGAYYTSEHELILQRDSEIQITKTMRSSDGVLVLEGTYLGSKPAPLTQRGAHADAAGGREGVATDRWNWVEADFESGGVWIA